MELEELFESFLSDKEDLCDKVSLLPRFQSEFQLLNFNLLKGAETEFGVLKRCINELTGRLDTLQGMYFSYERYKIDIEELTDKLLAEKNRFEKRRFQLNKQEKELSLRNLEKSASAVYHEISILRKPFEILHDKMRDQDLNALEKDYWTRKYGKEASLLLKHGKLLEFDNFITQFSADFVSDIAEHLPLSIKREKNAE
jgi:hypothetical protein